METLVKENHLLKQQLQNCFAKVAKTQKVGQMTIPAKIFVAVFKVYCCRDFLFNSRYVFPFKIARRGSYKHLSGTRRTQADV